ncbi:MAG TPA: hypothetical protein VJ937_09185 [Salinivirga sp.]|uniref:hypothetical protein n=1 Tax=Salinivirga sp. TaxID=1970192 RepID=UPI002B46A2EF|nr:hypothetical protein [Salinivirga sp.]HKK59639.1 hypothetical protein [Salinivirga sp.]
MKQLLIIILLAFMAVAGYGQTNSLVLEKKRNGKQKILPAATKIKVVTYDGNKYKGEFHIANKSTLLMGSDSVKLHDIKKIRFKSKLGMYTGTGVGILGGIITVSGTVLIIQSLAEGGLAGIIGIVFGVPVVGAGGVIVTAGVLVATIGRQYKPKKWTYKLAP